jgi:hypothetical protein
MCNVQQVRYAGFIRYVNVYAFKLVQRLSCPYLHDSGAVFNLVYDLLNNTAIWKELFPEAVLTIHWIAR